MVQGALDKSELLHNLEEDGTSECYGVCAELQAS
jgi:hypothetical protein